MAGGNCHLDWLQLVVSSSWVDALHAVVLCCCWVRADRSGLAAAFSPAGALPWQNEKVLMADMAEGVELKNNQKVDSGLGYSVTGLFLFRDEDNSH